MVHDRIHAREPTHDRQRWDTGVITAITERDGHCVFTVEDDEEFELTVTLAIRDLVLSRLDLDEGASPIGSKVWFRRHGQG